MLYADTSLLVSYYVSDANSDRATAAVNAAAEPFAFTTLHRLEIRNALELAVFRKRISATESAAAWADVVRDVRARLLAPVAVEWGSAFRLASRLAAKHSATVGARSFDILHVAAALRLGIRTIFTFDGRQSSLASLAGLWVLP